MVRVSVMHENPSEFRYSELQIYLNTLDCKRTLFPVGHDAGTIAPPFDAIT
jgi:hypothetical protein